MAKFNASDFEGEPGMFCGWPAGTIRLTTERQNRIDLLEDVFRKSNIAPP